MADEDTKKTVEKKKVAGKSKGSGKMKIKPVLSKDVQKALEIRKERYENQPKFDRGEWFRYKKLKRTWRRPRAVTNKMRLKKAYRPSKVRIGFGKPALVRNLHPSGFVEKMVYNVADLEDIDPKVHAARIGSTVGTRKRRVIVEEADSKGIRILNRGVL